MQRDDQRVVNYYFRVAREAAARHLLVDYHGAHKPAGLNRTWPNVLTFEGVHGLENNKWTDDVTPTHNVTLPFTRMLAGPMDYTPGAMLNAQPRNFRAIFDRPMSIGTRTHQLAMYVVFESPLQMLADSPSEYEREPDAMEWLRAVPVTWDETRPLDAAVGSHVLVARRHGARVVRGRDDESLRAHAHARSLVPRRGTLDDGLVVRRSERGSERDGLQEGASHGHVGGQDHADAGAGWRVCGEAQEGVRAGVRAPRVIGERFTAGLGELLRPEAGRSPITVNRIPSTVFRRAAPSPDTDDSPGCSRSDPVRCRARRRRSGGRWRSRRR